MTLLRPSYACRIMFGALVALAASTSQALMIDSFDETSMTIMGGATGVTVPALEALGGFRTVSTAGTENVLVNTGSFVGKFSAYLSGFGSYAATLHWDGNGAGLGGIDLTADGSNAFEILIGPSVDSMYTLRIGDTGGNLVSRDFTVISIPIADPPIAVLGYSEFGSLVDLTSVASLNLTMTGLSGATGVQIDYVRTVAVAEPGVLGTTLLGIGLASLGYARRRTSK